MNKFFTYPTIVGAVLFSVAEIQGAADTADDTTYFCFRAGFHNIHLWNGWYGGNQTSSR